VSKCRISDCKKKVVVYLVVQTKDDRKPRKVPYCLGHAEKKKAYFERKGQLLSIDKSPQRQKCS
jgi:hypothetical protein